MKAAEARQEAGIKLLQVLKRPGYLALALASAAAMLALYIYTQLLGILENLDVWLAVLPLHNAVLLAVFTLLFGATFAYQAYVWREAKTCSAWQKAAGTGASSSGTFGLFFVAQCPACASLGALFLPLSATAVLMQYSWLLNLAGIGLLLFTLNYLGAFQRT